MEEASRNTLWSKNILTNMFKGVVLVRASLALGNAWGMTLIDTSRSSPAHLPPTNTAFFLSVAPIAPHASWTLRNKGLPVITQYLYEARMEVRHPSAQTISGRLAVHHTPGGYGQARVVSSHQGPARDSLQHLPHTGDSGRHFVFTGWCKIARISAAGGAPAAVGRPGGSDWIHPLSPSALKVELHSPCGDKTLGMIVIIKFIMELERST